MTTLTEGNYVSDLVKYEAGSNYYSREIGTILDSADLVLGTVLGQVVDGAISVAAAVAGANTGGGGVTLASPAYGENVQVGTYTLKCILAPGSNGGTFELRDPQGDVVASDIRVGTAETGTHLKFTVGDVGTDFALGDSFTIAVTRAAGSNKYKALDPAGTDGSEIAAAVLLQDAAAADADVPNCKLLARHAIVRADKLVWPDGITDAQKSAALAQLEARGITTSTGA